MKGSQYWFSLNTGYMFGSVVLPLKSIYLICWTSIVYDHFTKKRLSFGVLVRGSVAVAIGYCQPTGEVCCSCDARPACRPSGGAECRKLG